MADIPDTKRRHAFNSAWVRIALIDGILGVVEGSSNQTNNWRLRMNAALWIVQIVLAFMFLMAGGMKLMK